MQIFTIEGNRQWLDGGAMFGSCPRPVWEKWCKPDNKNRIELACRTLLVRESSGRHVLFETGIGAFFEPKLKERYGVVQDEHVLLHELSKLQIKPKDIDIIVLSHLHFDHAGGLLNEYRPGKSPSLAFPNARFVVSKGNWERSLNPHIRDRASFLPAFNELLVKSGRLETVQSSRSFTLGAAYSFTFSDGHTPAMMMTRIECQNPGPITFVSDLVPGIPWLHLPISMGYDRFPELLVNEKQRVIERIYENQEFIFYTHDPNIAISRIDQNDQGKYIAIDSYNHI